MASIEERSKRRLSAYRVMYRKSVYSGVDDFHQKLRELFSDPLCVFFGRQVSVDSIGRACYDVVFDLYQRRQISDIQSVFGLKGDSASVELRSCPVKGDNTFVAREVADVCAAVCDGGKFGLWFGQLHERVGVCLRAGRCVEDERVGSFGQAVDVYDGPSVQSVIGGVIDGVSYEVQDIVSCRQYSEETVVRATEVVEERLKLAQLRFVHSLMRDRVVGGVSANQVAGFGLLENERGVDESGFRFGVPEFGVSLESGSVFDLVGASCDHDSVEEEVSGFDFGFESDPDFDWFCK